MWWFNKNRPEVTECSIQVNAAKEAPKALDLSKVVFKASPNCGKRTDQVRCVVLHHTGSTNFNGTVDWLCNKDAQASAHYVIGMDGTIKQLVKLEDASWNAGKSEWVIDGQKRIGLNGCSIGIELVNIGILEKGADGKFYYEDGRNLKEWKGEAPFEAKITYPDGKVVAGFGVKYPEAQIQAAVDLCKALVAKYPQIGREDFVTHYQIATPSGRKNDPFGFNVASFIDRVFS
jgi:N-acetyl-anhydromuramyl-L-alanine amidase AmpD